MTELAITPGLLPTLMVSAVAAIAVYLDTKRRSSDIPARGPVHGDHAAAAVAAVLVSLGLASEPPDSTRTPAVAPAPACPSPPSRC